MLGHGSFILVALVAVVSAQILQTENYDYCDPKLKLCDPPTDHTMCRFPNPGLSSRCTPSIQEPLSVAEKKRILFWHNKFRSNVANGTERSLNRKLPTATNMRQLYWDKELEVISARWAEQCTSQGERLPHDKCRNTKRFRVSQNVATRRVNDSSVDKQATQMVVSWYRESESFDPTLVTEFRALGDDKITWKRFANIIWAETFALGCARVIFRENSEESPFSVADTAERLVCNYGPGGNEIGEPIYKRGASCSECPDGTRCSLVFPGLCAVKNFAKHDFKDGQKIETEVSTHQAMTHHEKKISMSSDAKVNPTIAVAFEELEYGISEGHAVSTEVFPYEDADSRCPGDECWNGSSGSSSDAFSNPRLRRIEEIMKSPKSTARLLFEGFGKKAFIDGRDNRIFYNKNRERNVTVAKDRKVIREVLQTMVQGVQDQQKNGETCQCTDIIYSGGKAIFPEKAKFFILAVVTLELWNFR